MGSPPCRHKAVADSQMLQSADYIVPVEIESQTHNVYVIKRPGVDHFLTEMGKIYEVVVFTASLSKVSFPDASCCVALRADVSVCGPRVGYARPERCGQAPPVP